MPRSTFDLGDIAQNASHIFLHAGATFLDDHFAAYGRRNSKEPVFIVSREKLLTDRPVPLFILLHEMGKLFQSLKLPMREVFAAWSAIHGKEMLLLHAFLRIETLCNSTDLG